MNEIMDKVKETDDLLLLIEQHKKEIWEWKQKESKWLEDKVLLDGTKKLVNKLSEELMRMKKRAQEAEGENTIIKGIGNSSPEMEALQVKIKEAQEINKLHQELNGKLQVELTEIKEDNKKLSYQVEDKVNTIRESGL
jgi:adenylosuccinate synthase